MSHVGSRAGAQSVDNLPSPLLRGGLCRVAVCGCSSAVSAVVGVMVWGGDCERILKHLLRRAAVGAGAIEDVG